VARTSAGALAARDRLEQLEVLSYEVEHVNALRHLDFHHDSRKVLTSGCDWAKPTLLGGIDDRARLGCHLQ
jgi:putative transposase